uniref:Uncharacterized protein n=1 Tax=Solanum tuberosum TaxID=4113 RepID=M1DJ82_SOLTU
MLGLGEEEARFIKIIEFNVWNSSGVIPTSYTQVTRISIQFLIDNVQHSESVAMKAKEKGKDECAKEMSKHEKKCKLHVGDRLT